MKFKFLIIITMLFLLSVSGSTKIYAEERGTSDNYNRLVDDLKSDDEAIRERAIDQFISEITENIEEIIEKSDVSDKDVSSEEDQQIKSLLLDAFSKAAEKPREHLKASLKTALKNSDTRDMIVPFMEIFLQMVKLELNKSLESDSKNNK